MKKNRMMRLASVLLVLVLLTTSVISGTFAKYVTTGSASDSARVAKWGVSFTTTSDLFQTEYAYDDTNFASEGKVSVKTTTTGQNLVAPGTTGNAYSCTVSGTPEVSYIVTFDLGDDFEYIFFGGDSKIMAPAYEPVVWSVSFGNTTISNEQDGIAHHLNPGKIESCAYYYDVADGNYYWTTGYDPDGTTSWTLYGTSAPALRISWNWPFDSFDAVDTALGNLAAGATSVVVNGTTYTGLTDGTDYNLEIVLPITATATQID